MTEITDWRHKYHLMDKVLFDWRDIITATQAGDTEAAGQFSAEIEKLAYSILKTNRFNLLGQYLDAYGQRISYRSDEQIDLMVLNKLFPYAIGMLYGKVCTHKGKLLVGSRGPEPLWVVLPDWATENGGTVKQWIWMVFMIHLMPYLGGDARQEQFDRLLLPGADRWTQINDWGDNLSDFRNLGVKLAHDLGYQDIATKEDLEDVLTDALLNRRYQLINNQPMVIELDNSEIRRLVLMQKDDFLLLTKVETFNHRDFIFLCCLPGKLSFFCQKTCRKVDLKPAWKQNEGLSLLSHILSCL